MTLQKLVMYLRDGYIIEIHGNMKRCHDTFANNKVVKIELG